VDEKQK
jgi:proton-coupled amino acid transporter